MSVLTKTSPLPKMPGKRLLEEGNYSSNEQSSKSRRTIHTIAESVRRAMKSIKMFDAFCNPILVKPLRIVAPTNVEKSSGGEDDEDCCIVEEKSSNVCKPKLATDQVGTTWENSRQIHGQGQTSGLHEFAEEEGQEDDVLILSPSEWEKQFHSSAGCDGKIKKEDTADQKSGKMVEEMEAENMENLAIVPYNAASDTVSRNNVQNALRHFDELYKKLLDEYRKELEGGPMSKQIHTRAAMLLKKQQKWVNTKPCFGHVPGVKIGDQFRFRVELTVVGLHHQQIAGINRMTVEGKEYANSVVDSGRYENRATSPDILLYSGQGQKSEDQKLQGGSLALKNSMEANYPVRVIRKTVSESVDAATTTKKTYVYEGLYKVSKFTTETSNSGKMSFMFELVRLSKQPDFNNLNVTVPRASRNTYKHSNVLTGYDVSEGKEKVPIMVVNEHSDEKPASFTYITKMIYPHSYKISLPEGCDCVDGCSDSVQCPCNVKNKGEIPFNEEGAIVKATRMVHECGRNCKCPPSCQNRVSQHGPRFPLDVFRTKSTGWGVRSRVEIPSGGFICEYVGELLQDKEADLRDMDEYLFDLDDGEGFTIDAAKYGNVGRFINHSCSPNLYAQNVLYDHDDKKAPHVMLFAADKIPAFKELSYDYNYKLNRVCDANGNIKTKACCCGARKCAGRLY